MISVAPNPPKIADLRPVTPVGLAAKSASFVRDRLVEDGTDGELLEHARITASILLGLESYLEESTTPPTEDLRRLAQATNRGDWRLTGRHENTQLESEMLSGHAAGSLLQFLLKSSHAKSALDVGMFTGYSALAMAEALPEAGHVVACEYDRAVADFAQKAFAESACGHKIEVRVGAAADTLRELILEGRQFDAVFLDADKQGYCEYYELVIGGGLLADDGVFCVDNTLLQGEPYAEHTVSDNGAAVAEFNRVVQEDCRVEQVLVPLRDGITLIRRSQ